MTHEQLPAAPDGLTDEERRAPIRAVMPGQSIIFGSGIPPLIREMTTSTMRTVKINMLTGELKQDDDPGHRPEKDVSLP